MHTDRIHLAPTIRLAMRTIAVVAALLVQLSPGAGHAQDSAAVRLDGERRSEIVAELSAILRANYAFPKTAEELASAITDRLRRGEYDPIEDPKVFSDSLTSHLHDVAADRHLWVSFRPVQPDASTDSQQADTRELSNFGFRKVEVFAGNVGYVDIQRFADPAGAGVTASAAMQFLALADAVIIDVRSGPGGHPGMVALLLSYFFEPAPVHLWDLYRRADDRTDQEWTSRYVPGDRLIAQPVFVLTSGRTFSASEALAYTLKHLGRATIVGERSGGGANPGRQHRIDDAFTVFVPNARVINPVTGTNWQGTGVAPDVTTPSELALDVAYVLALDELLERERDPDHVATLTQVRKEVNDRLEKARTGDEDLPPMSGHDDDRAVRDFMSEDVAADLPADRSNGYEAIWRRRGPAMRICHRCRDMMMIAQ
jgi:hypothetical protein